MIEEISLDEFSQIENLKESFPQTPVEIYAKGKKEDTPFTKCYVIKEKKKVIAIMLVDFIYERMELLQLEVRKEYQNQGYAHRLLESLITLAETTQKENITLEVREDNLVAIHLYKKYGFQECSLRKNYYGEKNAILMERKMM